jgi:sugar porter (SP) family MFS transporter
LNSSNKPDSAETKAVLAGSWYATLIAMAAALGGLLFGYDTSVISGAILFVREQFTLSSVETELAVSIVLAGAAIGAAVSGYLGDRFGRKPVLVGDAVLFASFAVATGMAHSFGIFLLARFMIGVAVGITSMITPLYIAELAPPKVRGALVTLNQLAIVIGIVVAYGVDYAFAPSGNWNAMFSSAVAPAVILLLALVFLPESPRWLADNGHENEAWQVLSRVESAQDAQRHLAELRDVAADKVKFSDLFSIRFRKPMIVGVGLAIFQQITGVNTVIYYTPTILQMAGFESAATAILATALVGAVNVVATVISLFLLDHVGRRLLLLISITGMGLSLLHLGYAFGASQMSRTVIMLDVIAYLASFALGLGPVFWLLISEIYPTTVRGRAMSVASVTIWVADCFVTMTFLSLVETLGPRVLFWLYAGTCAAALVFCSKLVPETKDRTLEEIETSW